MAEQIALEDIRQALRILIEFDNKSKIGDVKRAAELLRKFIKSDKN